MARKIEIFYDEQAGVSPGWAYRVDGGDSGTIVGAASDAIDRMCENIEPQDDDYRAIRAAVAFENGDQAWLDLGPGAYIDVEPLLTNY